MARRHGVRHAMGIPSNLVGRRAHPFFYSAVVKTRAHILNLVTERRRAQQDLRRHRRDQQLFHANGQEEPRRTAFGRVEKVRFLAHPLHLSLAQIDY